MNRRPEQPAAMQGMRRKCGIGIALLGAFALAAGVPAYAAETTPAAAPAAKPAATSVTPMSQEQLLEHQAKHPQHLVVLDVRSPEEFKEGHVPGAVNVPYDQIATRLSEVPKDKDVVLYCRSGRRAGIAAEVLQANGYTRLSHLEGDMNAWLEKGRPVEKP
jgi:rhodanese-related sulfurtransferase